MPRLLPLLLSLWLAPLGGAEPRAPLPPELLEDEHLREELGVNALTTPSIRKLFEELEALAPLPYARLRPEIPESVPADRLLIALQLGRMVADGFLVVQEEKLQDLEPLSRSILKFSKALGAGDRVKANAKSIIENAALGNTGSLKESLAKAQMDVEREMLELRDVDLAHLIALGGWVRAVVITGEAVLTDFQPEKAALLTRPDLVEYFLQRLEEFAPYLGEHATLDALRKEISTLRSQVDLPDIRPVQAAEVQAILATAKRMDGLLLGE
ncbi:MAG: hypothetical protein AAF555_06470 [Verrucomicrobiota bacterium]